jgi:hypothetical protein
MWSGGKFTVHDGESSQEGDFVFRYERDEEEGS